METVRYTFHFSLAQDLKERALRCIQSVEYTKAINYYERILKYIKMNNQDSDYQLALPIKIAANSNAALCHLKTKDYQKAKFKAAKVSS